MRDRWINLKRILRDFERPEKSAKILDVIAFDSTDNILGGRTYIRWSVYYSIVLWPYHHYPGADVLAEIMSQKIL